MTTHDEHAHSSDDAVIELIRQGQTHAFEILLARYEDFVFRMVRRHVPPADVEDTAQEAFIRAYRSLPAFHGRGNSFRAWLAAVVVRTCCDYWRRAYRSRETPVSRLTPEHERWLASALAESSQESLEARGAAEEAREILEIALKRLPAEDRMVLELVYLEGASGQEAAALLGWSATKVKVRCFRARRKLEAFLLKLKKSEKP
jgi:RNA polymerase sigma-70 factor (ECF subfamily)